MPIEFKRHGIRKIEQANEFLNHYIQKYNQQFALQLDKSKNVFQMQENLKKLDTILAIITPRKIQSGYFTRNTSHTTLTEIKNYLIEMLSA